MIHFLFPVPTFFANESPTVSDCVENIAHWDSYEHHAADQQIKRDLTNLIAAYVPIGYPADILLDWAQEALEDNDREDCLCYVYQFIARARADLT